MEILSIERARKMLYYDENAGILVWKEKPNRNIRVGDIAGTLHDGRIAVGIDKRRYQIGRLVWFMYHGSWPSGVIDHINGDPTDNKISNLRDVSQRANVENKRKATSISKSKILGVTWHVGNKKWRATIITHKKQKTIGYFDNKEDAGAAYINAKRLIHKGNTL